MHTTLTTDTEIEELHLRVAAVERELGLHRERLRRELDLAATVHRSLLPKPVRSEQIDVDLRYIPVDQVGGDYCQIRFADRDTLFIALCDVTGHGIGSALLATRVSSEVRYGILYGRSPRDIVRTLNTFIYDHFSETNLYLSFVVAEIDLRRRRITWCGAGHPSPLLIRRNGLTIQPLHSQNILIGVLEDVLSDRTDDTLELEPGDRLLFYTDGLTETANAEGRQLGTAGLAEIAVEAMGLDLFEMADGILDSVARHQRGPSVDDKTLVVAEINPFPRSLPLGL